MLESGKSVDQAERSCTLSILPNAIFGAISEAIFGAILEALFWLERTFDESFLCFNVKKTNNKRMLVRGGHQFLGTWSSSSSSGPRRASAHQIKSKPSFVFFSHQLGSFLGVWLGGRMYDLYGDYTMVWWIGVGVGAFSAIVHLPIRENRTPEAVAA